MHHRVDRLSRAARRDLAADLIDRIAEAARERRRGRGARRGAALPRRGSQPVDRPARIPAALQEFADAALERLLADRVAAVARARRGAERAQARHLVRAARLDRRAGRASRSTAARACSTTTASSSSTARRTAPAAAMRRSCAGSPTARSLDATSVARRERRRRELLAEWLRAGWCVAEPGGSTRRRHDRRPTSPRSARAPSFSMPSAAAFTRGRENRGARDLSRRPELRRLAARRARGDRLARRAGSIRAGSPSSRTASTSSRAGSCASSSGAGSGRTWCDAATIRTRGRADPDAAARPGRVCVRVLDRVRFRGPCRIDRSI